MLFRPRARFFFLHCAAATVLLLPPRNTHAQQLARPGWSGFHTQSETWWKHAVFYHVEPALFQDSNGDGRGDLRGVALRLDYLESLGVDAVLLDVPINDEGFDDLIHEASRRHIRLVLEVYADAPDAIAVSRLWLTRGASGLYIHTAGAGDLTAFNRELQALTQQFPGTRLLVSDSDATTGSVRALDLSIDSMRDSPRTASRSEAANVDVLVPEQIVGDSAHFAASLRRALVNADSVPATATPLLATDDDQRSADRYFDAGSALTNLVRERAVAAVLLASRGAARLEYAQELGAVSPPGFAGNIVMPWTPANHSDAKLAEPLDLRHDAQRVNEAPAPPAQEVFGAYHPYVAPRPKAKPLPGAAPDPDDLPGFTTGALAAAQAANHSTANVAVEESNHNSLLATYRRLLQLRHETPALLTGTQTICNAGGDEALVWLRRAPAGTTTTASVVVAVNTTTHEITLDLGAELAREHVRGRGLRALYSTADDAPLRSASALTLAPAELFVGEVR